MTERVGAPGLKWRPRKAGAVPYWIAPPGAVEAGFRPKLARLSGTDAEIVARCHRLQAEVSDFLGNRNAPGLFDGTWRALFDFYERDPESTYKRLRPGSLVPYSVYLRKLRAHIGALAIVDCDGRDVLRWFEVWAAPRKPGGRRQVAAARMALAVVKAAISWGIQCRKPACADFQAILGEMEFESTKPRTEAPTARQIEAARLAAHAEGKPLRGLAYALQFETTLRQWDIIGQWLDLGDPRPSAVLGYGQKWIGLLWSHIGPDLVLRYTPGKTDETSGAKIVADLNECPMVLAELAGVPEEARRGPVILDEATGAPYRYRDFLAGWKSDFAAAGLPASVWNRDLRASGVTEARAAGAPTDDVQKIAGHTDKRTTAAIYDRATLEAHRRVARARTAHRLNKPGT